MSFRRRWSIRSLLALLVLFASGSSFLLSQEKGVDALQTEVKGKYRVILRKLISGEEPADPKNQEHVDALKTETMLLTLQFVDPLYLDATPGDKSKSMDILIQKVNTDVGVKKGSAITEGMAKNPAKTQAAAKLFTQFFCENAKYVILQHQRRTPVSSLNLTRAPGQPRDPGPG